MNIKRQFFQIYTELERPQFNGKDKTEHTLRALILETLASHGLREVTPRRKGGVYGFEDLIRLRNPEAEIKYGITCQSLYVQVSVSESDVLKKLNDKVLRIFQKFNSKEAFKNEVS
jgi:hypothetical protein